MAMIHSRPCKFRQHTLHIHRHRDLCIQYCRYSWTPKRSLAPNLSQTGSHYTSTQTSLLKLCCMSLLRTAYTPPIHSRP